MGLRCLIGHDFGEPQIERDRDEQGDEVVVTIREFKECARCGERQTVTENKEITSLAAPEPEPEPEPSESSSPSSSPPSGESFENVTAEEDDGIILTDDPDEESSRGHGEWPTADVATEETSTSSVTSNGEVEASGDAETDSDIGGEAGDAPDVTAGATDDDGGSEPTEDSPPSTVDTEHAWPEVDEAADTGYDAETTDGEVPQDAFTDDYSTATKPATPDSGEVIETAAGGGASGIVSEQPGPIPGHQQRETPGVETELVCPSCDHTLDSAGSSLRPGDICPECAKGYLAERESSASRNK